MASVRRSTNMRAQNPVIEERLRANNRLKRLTNRLNDPMADYYMLMVVAGLLIAIGQVMVLSASTVWSSVNYGNPYHFFVRQLVFLILALPVAWVLSRLKMVHYHALSWISLSVSIFLLVLVFTPLGHAEYGNRSWLRLGALGSIQPSEFAKFSLVMWAASIFANRRQTLDEPKRLLFPLLLGYGVVLGLVLAQHDLGTAVIIFIIMFATLWFVGAPPLILLSLGGAAAVGVGALILFDSERVKRFTSFLGNSTDGSDQPLNAIYGLASGGWWGLGPGRSLQKWGGLYNGAQTDYVFAVLGEELGLMGSMIVIGLFALLGYVGMRIALRSAQPFFRYAAAGITAWICLQAVLNIAVVMRLLPVFGVPLPFLSQGGSALISNVAGIGVLLAAARNEPAAIEFRKAKTAKHPKLISVVDTGKGGRKR